MSARGEEHAPLFLAPLRLERRAIRRGAPGARVVRTGMGARRARLAAQRSRALPSSALVVIGFAGAVALDLEPGDLVVAERVLDPDGGALACPLAPALARELSSAGLRTRVGQIASSPRIVRAEARARLRASGVLAVDLESSSIATVASGRPFAVVRAIVDTPRRELLNPLATSFGAARAYRALVEAAGPLARLDWAELSARYRLEEDMRITG